MQSLLERSKEERPAISFVEEDIISSLNGQLTSDQKIIWKEGGFDSFLEELPEKEFQKINEYIKNYIEKSEKIFVAETSKNILLGQLGRITRMLAAAQVDKDFDIVEKVNKEITLDKKGRAIDSAGVLGEIMLAKRYFDKKYGIYSLLRNRGADNLEKFYKSTSYLGLKRKKLSTKEDAISFLENVADQIESLLISNDFIVLDPADKSTWKF